MSDSPYDLDEDLAIDARTFVDPLKEQQTPSAYRLAFADPDFLMSPETRHVRVSLELLKADLALAQYGITSTIAVFGSARLLSEEDAKTRLQEAQVRIAQSPDDPEAQKNLCRAQKLVRDAHYYEDARAIGRLVGTYERNTKGRDKIFICTGGGPGIMEAANRGAHEVGSPNIGLNIVLPHEQFSNPYITPDLCFRFHYFATRKMHFMMRAKVLITFPGGFGTLDELFEVLTLIQTTKTKPLPVILYGSEFWKKLINFEQLVEMGMISPEDIDLFHYADTPTEALKLVQQWYQVNILG